MSPLQIAVARQDVLMEMTNLIYGMQYNIGDFESLKRLEKRWHDLKQKLDELPHLI
ncbi:hypothetical protein ABFT51_20760 [Paenibacillus peoriae]|uniref:hypothetical protein n=1 Tax=Paenibacillus peoriae TaxID=59893 RepID=UPI0032AEF9BE